MSVYDIESIHKVRYISQIRAGSRKEALVIESELSKTPSEEWLCDQEILQELEYSVEADND